MNGMSPDGPKAAGGFVESRLLSDSSGSRNGPPALEARSLMDRRGCVFSFAGKRDLLI